jgi:hypothetical protein
MQTREHILADCPIFEPYRHHLRAASRGIDIPFILGTTSGLEALARFIETSQAFAKAPIPTSALSVPDPNCLDTG